MEGYKMLEEKKLLSANEVVEVSPRDEFLSEIEKLSTEKIESLLTFVQYLLKNNKESKPEKTEVAVNKYKVDYKEATGRLMEHRDFAKSPACCMMVDVANEFMAICSGKTKDEMKDWFPGDFIAVNPNLAIYLESFIYLRGFQAGHVDSRERAKRAKKARSKKNDAVVLKRAV